MDNIPPRMPLWLHVAGLAIVSFGLSGFMAAGMVALNVGIDRRFLPAFLANWAIGFVVSLPAVMVVLPPVIRWQMRVMSRRRS